MGWGGLRFVGGVSFYMVGRFYLAFYFPFPSLYANPAE
jgi:hypothetical protein